MITVENLEVKEASRIYGDIAEKIAMNIDVQAAPTIGAIVGGVVTAKMQNKLNAKHKEKTERLERDFYAQAGNILKNLKIVFTPINVIYSVNNQVFEIVGVNEMDAYMQKAFLEKNGEYFKNLLVNKMNMELQLAQQAFTQRMMQNYQQKQASFLDQQVFLKETSDEQFENILSKVASLSDESIGIPLNLDSLRPFDESSDFTNPDCLVKVAGLFDIFKKNKPVENLSVSSLTVDDIKKQVDIGFLPDRVVFLYNGQMFEQMTLLSMNEKGYEAFLKKDKDFFKRFLIEASTKIQHAVMQNVNSLEKQSASLEEVVQEMIEPEVISTKPDINIFIEPDVHPLVYFTVLNDRYGKSWYELEMEALLKQIEMDYAISDSINDIALNKIAVIHSLLDDETSIFGSAFTFEKFSRTMNGKEIDFVTFEGNLSMSEILFSLEMAKILRGEAVFETFNDTISQYVAQELYDNDVRHISSTIFDDGFNEVDFFEDVNGYLMRKFKERDSLGAASLEKINIYHQTAELIVLISDQILEKFADEIQLDDIAGSVNRIITKYKFTDFIPDQYESGVRQAVVINISSHFETAFFLEYKKEEMKAVLAMMNALRGDRDE